MVACLALAALALGFVCDQSHAPVLRNGLDEPVQLSVAYADGRSFSGWFPPGARIYAPAEGLALQRVEIRTSDQLVVVVDGEQIERLSGEFPASERLVWTVQRDGLHPTRLSSDR
jgi:hypothetical protein